MTFSGFVYQLHLHFILLTKSNCKQAVFVAIPLVLMLVNDHRSDGFYDFCGLCFLQKTIQGETCIKT